MAHIDANALINSLILFNKSSLTLDSEKRLVMRPESKNCTVLYNSTSTSDVNFTNQEDESISSSGSDLDSVGYNEEASASSGLRLIRSAYGKRSGCDNSPYSPQSRKKMKLVSSSRSSTVSSRSVSSFVPGYSSHGIKLSSVSDSITKISTKEYINRISVESRLKTREFTEDGVISRKLKCESNEKIAQLNGKSQVPSQSATTINSEYDQKPSTSKMQPIDNQSIVSNGSLKKRFFGDLSSRSVLIKNQHSLTPRALNGKVIRNRVLSERGEIEAKFPMIDRKNIFISWRGSRLLRPDGRNSGVGLFNHSNDCFLNVVLQLMVHTAPLARFVAEQHSSFSCPQNCFICALGMHVRRAITSQVPFKAQWIQPHLRKIFPSHLPGFQEDAHELFNLLLDALDTDSINLSKNKLNLSSGSQLDQPRLSTYVEQIFGGTVRNQMKCMDCSEILINYERIRELNLGLRMKTHEGPLCMDDLLSDYFDDEILNNFSCKTCKRKTEVLRNSRILRAPCVLLIQLKRFNSYGAKIRLPVSAEMNLHLDTYMYRSNEHHIYQLNGLIEHQGAGLDHGHYVAAVRGFDGKTWHFFDDEICQKVSAEEVQKRQAYLLLYVRRDVIRESHSFSSTLGAQCATSVKSRLVKDSFSLTSPNFR